MSFYYIRKEIGTGTIYYDSSRGVGFDPLVEVDDESIIGFVLLEEDLTVGYILLENGYKLLLES